MRRIALLLIALTLAACARGPAELPGTLEWDRVALPAEASEPILKLAVNEGDAVAARQVLAELDPRRMDARIAGAEAQVAQLEARLDELVRGARSETIDAARARLAQARAAQTESERTYARIAELRKRQWVAANAFDQAQAARNAAQAETRAAAAQLDELLNGTRSEQLAQARATLEAAQESLRELRVSRERLTLRAPRAGRVDALPFKLGDQPPAGATVVSLLVGDAPYARVFVPAPQRAALVQGMRFEVKVEGVDAPFPATLRRIAREASFTPYFALAGDDASRLVYRAELVLEGEAAKRLPAGLTAQAKRVEGGPVESGRE